MPDSKNVSSPNDSNQSGVPHKNALEWTVFALSAVLVLGTLGYLVFAAATQKASPPAISVELGKAQPVAAQFRVPVTIFNKGGQTAQGVQIEVTLNEGEPNEEKATFTTDYLPRYSRREGAVLFKSEPRAGKLKPRVLGYQNP